MDSGTGSSADQTRDASLHVCARNVSKASRSLAAVAQTRRSTKCVHGSKATPRLDKAQDPQRRPWADLPVDILGDAAGRLALLEDRARLRTICRAWRGAARTHWRLPPCPPLLVLSDFSFFSLGSEGTMMGNNCRRVPLPERETPASGSIRCVGSFEGWLVGVKSNKSRYFGDLRCFLMNAFSQAVIRLPPPSGGAARFAGTFRASLPIINGGSGVVSCAINAAPCVMSFSKVVVSSPPDSGSKCIVAAISEINGAAKLALWRSGMRSWCVCDGGWSANLIDTVFYQGKLFMLSFGQVSTDLLVFEIADGTSGLMVSHVELCAIEMPVVSYGCWKNIWSIVEWHGKLLIVQTCHGNDEVGESFVEVRVFEADFSTNPVRFTEIESLDGDCIFISPCSSKSFHSCPYGGGGGDLIYIFFSGHLYRFVYNMKDGTTAPFASDIPEDKLFDADGKVMNSSWLFPPG